MSTRLGPVVFSAKARPLCVVSAAQLEVLSGFASGVDRRLELRARIVLLAAGRKSVEAIADELGVAHPTVYKWCRRFVRHGTEGLRDLPRTGQPRRLAKAVRDEIVRITTQEAPPDGPRWTIRTAARLLGVTQHQIRQVWSDAGVRPHQTAHADSESLALGTRDLKAHTVEPLAAHRVRAKVQGANGEGNGELLPVERSLDGDHRLGARLEVAELVGARQPDTHRDVDRAVAERADEQLGGAPSVAMRRVL